MNIDTVKGVMEYAWREVEKDLAPAMEILHERKSKMKLVVTYWMDVEWVASWGVTLPLEYESKEQFIEDFGNWAKDNRTDLWGFKGNSDLTADVYYSEGNCNSFAVRTLEEWFEDFKEEV